MKNILSIILVAALGSLIAFTSCKKKDTYEEVELKTVVISGTVYADLDATNIGLEKVGSGTKIIFRIDSRDLVQAPVGTHVYEILQYETTTNGDGYYEIALPTVKFNNVTVDIIPVDFEKEQKQAGDTYKKTVFTGNPAQITTSEGERYYQNLTYF
ncbi:MAG TPA: hypothetical protein PLG05_04285 [Bacteroidales bacterium]|nr:hypothetical protein [Bacteroidales bacterium]HOR60021.1 hypothetical protein [Bacteroidales bacterium]HPL04373.1 hypothetical protein [Bacteroidales bacterium]